jgi:hypothetical protein
MTPLFKKLNFKAHGALTVLDSPGSFEEELAALKSVEIRRDGSRETPFLIAFVTTLKDVGAAAKVAKTKTSGDAVVWMAYPKGTSKNYKCDFNRDTGWAALGYAGFEPVRMVAIDEDWSAIRFRRAEFIKTMTPDPKSMLSEKGKARSKKT